MLKTGISFSCLWFWRRMRATWFWVSSFIFSSSSNIKTKRRVTKTTLDHSFRILGDREYHGLQITCKLRNKLNSIKGPSPASLQVLEQEWERLKSLHEKKESGSQILGEGQSDSLSSRKRNSSTKCKILNTSLDHSTSSWKSVGLRTEAWEKHCFLEGIRYRVLVSLKIVYLKKIRGKN